MANYLREILDLCKKNIQCLARWRTYWPPKNGKPTVLMAPIFRKPEPFYQSWQKGIEGAGWNFTCLYREWDEIQVCDQLLIFIFLCLRVQAVHFVDIDLNTLFGVGNRVRTRASFGLLRFLVFWPKLWRRHVVYSFGNPTPHDSASSAEQRRHRLICSLAQDVVCHYPTSQRELVEMGIPAEHIWPVEHADIAAYYHFSNDRPDPCQEFNLPPYALIIGFVGSNRPYKGLDVLIREFSLTKNPDLRLLIAGKPDSMYSAKELQALTTIDSRIILGPLRFLSNEEMGWILSGLDFLALPYRALGHSGQVCLALGLGLPVIASSIGCLPDYLQSGAGLLFNPEKTGDLARQLDQLDKFDHQHASQIGLQIMQPRTAEVIGRRLVKIYEYREGSPLPEKNWLF